jgi:hypothetical protein
MVRRDAHDWEVIMSLCCPQCRSTDLIPTGRSILVGKTAYRCSACQLALAPVRSRIVLRFFFLFSLLMLLLGIGFWVFLLYLAEQPVQAEGERRVIRINILLYLWPVIAAGALILSVRELLRPKPVRSTGPDGPS